MFKIIETNNKEINNITGTDNGISNENENENENENGHENENEKKNKERYNVIKYPSYYKNNLISIFVTSNCNDINGYIIKIDEDSFTLLNKTDNDALFELNINCNHSKMLDVYKAYMYFYASLKINENSIKLKKKFKK